MKLENNQQVLDEIRNGPEFTKSMESLGELIREIYYNDPSMEPNEAINRFRNENPEDFLEMSQQLYDNPNNFEVLNKDFQNRLKGFAPDNFYSGGVAAEFDGVEDARNELDKAGVEIEKPSPERSERLKKDDADNDLEMEKEFNDEPENNGYFNEFLPDPKEEIEPLIKEPLRSKEKPIEVMETDFNPEQADIEDMKKHEPDDFYSLTENATKEQKCLASQLLDNMKADNMHVHTNTNRQTNNDINRFKPNRNR